MHRLLYILPFALLGCSDTFIDVLPEDPVLDAREQVAGYWVGRIAPTNREARFHLALTGELDGMYTHTNGNAYNAVGSYAVSVDSVGRVMLGIRYTVGALGTAEMVGLLTAPDSMRVSWHNAGRYFLIRTNPFPEIQ